MLPGKPDLPVAPFLSLVINVNVTTLAHRDAKDKLLCLVLAVGNFTSGELVLYEQGLVLELRNGDFGLSSLIKARTLIWSMKGRGHHWCCTLTRSLRSGRKMAMVGLVILPSTESLLELIDLHRLTCIDYLVVPFHGMPACHCGTTLNLMWGRFIFSLPTIYLSLKASLKDSPFSYLCYPCHTRRPPRRRPLLPPPRAKVPLPVGARSSQLQMPSS